MTRPEGATAATKPKSEPSLNYKDKLHHPCDIFPASSSTAP